MMIAQFLTRRRLLIQGSRLAALTVGAGALAGCANPGKPLPAFTLSSSAPWKLRVDRLEVETTYVAPRMPPNIDHVLSPTLAQAAEIWARQKLLAQGSQSPGTIARFILRRASIIETSLLSPGGIRSLVADDPAFRYDAILEADLEIRNAAGSRDRLIAVRQDANRTLSERSGDDERRALWAELVMDMIERMGRSFDQAIPSNLGPFLTY